MKLLCLDIEVSPAIVYAWDLRVPGGYISPEKIIEPKRLLCFAGKWTDENDVHFFSEWEDGREEMIRKIWDLLDAADAVLHYYGTNFDIPWLRTEFALLGMPPPSPFAQVDMCKIIKKNFTLLSSSLKSASQAFGTVSKLENEGFALWRKVLDGDELARRQMEDYCIGDTFACEDLYKRLLPWIPDHPSYAVIDGEDDGRRCPQCGSTSVKPSGYAYTTLSRFERYICGDCGKYSRGTRRVAGAALRSLP